MSPKLTIKSALMCFTCIDGDTFELGVDQCVEFEDVEVSNTYTNLLFPCWKTYPTRLIEYLLERDIRTELTL